MSEPTDRPLHVQVAEALGCQPGHITHYRNGTAASHPYWTCTCPGEIHNCDGPDGAPHEGQQLEDYNTDWSATGPLIERLKISLEANWVGTDGEKWLAYVGAATPRQRHSQSFGTPLEAACRLIVALAAATPTGKLELR